MPGYKPYNLYAFRGANPAMAKKIDPVARRQTAVVFHSTSSIAVNTRAGGRVQPASRSAFKTTDKPIPGSVYYKTLGTKGVDFDLARAGWCADYFDPFDYINVNLDGRSIQDANNVNYAYLNSPKLNAAMDAAPRSRARLATSAYQKLDYTIMKNYAPWVPYVDRQRRVLRRPRESQLRLLDLLRRAGLQRAGRWVGRPRPEFTESEGRPRRPSGPVQIIQPDTVFSSSSDACSGRRAVPLRDDHHLSDLLHHPRPTRRSSPAARACTPRTSPASGTTSTSTSRSGTSTCNYLWNLIYHQDLGRSFVNRQSVNQIIGAGAPVTAVARLRRRDLLAAPLDPGRRLLGSQAALARRPRSMVVRALRDLRASRSGSASSSRSCSATSSGTSPCTRRSTATATSSIRRSGPSAAAPSQWAYHMILPWCTFMLLFAALYVRLIRANVMETMDEDYVRTARAKGAG